MKYLLASGVTLALAVSAVTARAEDAFTLNKGQVGANLGGTIYTGDGDVSPYGFGLGVNGGYTLDMGLFLGARFEYFLGNSRDVTVPLIGSESVRFNDFNFMIEPGYDIGVAENMVIRPMLGLGLADYRTKACITAPGLAETCSSNSESKFAMAPGALFLIDFGGFYGVAGLRYQHTFIDQGNVDGIHLTAGAGMAF